MSQTKPDSPSQPVKIQAGGVKKARNEGLKVITANDLFGGHVIYWTKDRSWTDRLSEAVILEGDAALSELTLAVADESRSVGPYLMDVSAENLPAGRGRLREEIRDLGPTIHPQFGRQAN